MRTAESTPIVWKPSVAGRTAANSNRASKPNCSKSIGCWQSCNRDPGCQTGKSVPVVAKIRHVTANQAHKTCRIVKFVPIDKVTHAQNPSIDGTGWKLRTRGGYATLALAMSGRVRAGRIAPSGAKFPSRAVD